MTPFETVLSRLTVVKRRGKQCDCRCPGPTHSHGDKKPSLSVNESEAGDVLLKCHAGCETSDILAAIGLELKDLFSNKDRRPKDLIAKYDYADADGKLLYQVCRYMPKTFKQRRPDGHGGWLWNMQGVERVPYRLSEVVKVIEAGQPVFICEGEKDCDRLASLGLAATTNSGGAGKWKNVLSKHFTDANVVIFPDNDEPGKKHAEQVAQSLHEVGAIIKAVELPPENRDVSHYLETHDMNELLQLVLITPLWKPTKVAAALQPKPAPKGAKTADYLRALVALSYEIRLNDLDDTIEVNGKPVDDFVESEIVCAMCDLGYNKARTQDAIKVVAGRARYHPVKDYFIDMPLEFPARFPEYEKLLSKLAFKPDSAVIAESVIRKWMLGCINKVFKNGQQNFMLVLTGKQGVGKSWLAKWLSPMPGYTIESRICPDDKDYRIKAAKTFIWVVDELSSTTRRADIEGLKAFITRESVSDRKAYGRYETRKPVLANYIGTENAAFLNDPTGSRRYVTLELEDIDFSYAELNIHQIWAEMFAAWMLDEGGILTADEKNWQLAINDMHQTRLAVELYFDEVLEVNAESEDWLSSVDILAAIKGAGLKIGSEDKAFKDLSVILRTRGARQKKVKGIRGFAGVRRKLPNCLRPERIDPEGPF